MTPALTALGWTLVLAIVQIALAGAYRIRETSLAWNAGPRDDPPPIGRITARLQRAQANLYETLPLFGLAVLAAWAAHRESHAVDVAAWTYFVARIVYVPLYWFGVPWVRTLAFAVGLLALSLILWDLLVPMALVF